MSIASEKKWTPCMDTAMPMNKVIPHESKDFKQEPEVFTPVIDRNRCEDKADCVPVCPYTLFAVGTLPKRAARWIKYHRHVEKCRLRLEADPADKCLRLLRSRTVRQSLPETSPHPSPHLAIKEIKETMKDKIVLITGGTGGIGKQTALTLAKMGARVVVTGRSQTSGEVAVHELRQLSGSQQVELLIADHSARQGVRSLAGQFNQRYERLDVLINNAGLAAPQLEVTADGIESNFAVNVLAPFLLTHLLIDRLKASPAARVISLTGGEAKGQIELDNLQAERSFSGLTTYSHAKLVLMAVMYEFAQRTQGTNMTVNVCYPGQASTQMTRSVTPEMLPGFMRLIWPLFKRVLREDGGQSAAKASRSSVYLATSAEVAGLSGKYFDTNCKMVAWPKAVIDSETRQKLWTFTERLSEPV